MGRTTWASLRGRALPGRINVVLSRRPGFEAPGALVAGDLDAGLAAARAAEAERVLVIGGAVVYAEAFARPDAGSIYLTRVAGRFPADTFLPAMPGFALAATLAEGEDGGIRWRIERWARPTAA
jgi:dihydrofolate reductase